MSNHSQAFVDAFRLLLNDPCGHLEETDSLVTRYAEWSVEDCVAACDLIRLVIRGLPGEHELQSNAGKPRAQDSQ